MIGIPDNICRLILYTTIPDPEYESVGFRYSNPLLPLGTECLGPSEGLCLRDPSLIFWGSTPFL